jgi:uncharacterized membrane protein
MRAPRGDRSATIPDGGGADRRTAANVWSGVAFGVGLMAFVDEAVFHQLLHWHHFYDRGSTAAGLVSDGILHAFSWFATIGGLFLLADLRRTDALHWRRWTGGALLGAGGFQLYDGVVHHMLLRVHQIRYVDDTLPYDIAWNAAAVVLLAVGVGILLTARPRRGAHGGRP